MKLDDQIHQAAQLIKKGELVAFPTETVYGLGADAMNAKAVKSIYKRKGRPQNNPLIVHISKRSQLSKLVKSIPPEAELLMDAFWPGPLTILFSKKPKILSEVTAGLSTIAIRMPSHPIALRLIEMARTPIAAPSANPSGKPSATHHDHVANYFGEDLFCIKGGATDIGVESTVVQLSAKGTIILRAGAITKEDLTEVLKAPVTIASHTDAKPLSPGMKYKHYTPNARLVLVHDRSQFQELLDQAAEDYSFVGVLGSTQLITSLEIHDNVLTQTLGNRKDLCEISRNLFARLHTFDDTKVKIILAEAFPKDGIGLAIMDKLSRASEG